MQVQAKCLIQPSVHSVSVTPCQPALPFITPVTAHDGKREECYDDTGIMDFYYLPMNKINTE